MKRLLWNSIALDPLLRAPSPTSGFSHRWQDYFPPWGARARSDREIPGKFHGPCWSSKLAQHREPWRGRVRYKKRIISNVNRTENWENWINNWRVHRKHLGPLFSSWTTTAGAAKDLLVRTQAGAAKDLLVRTHRGNTIHVGRCGRIFTSCFGGSQSIFYGLSFVHVEYLHHTGQSKWANAGTMVSNKCRA